MNKTRLRTLAVALAVALVAAACGGSTPSDSPETTMTSQVQSTTSIADPTTTTSGTTTSGGTDTTVGGTFELTVGAEDNEGFTRERLEGPAGTEISVTFINKDIGGEPHNWHIVVASGTEEYATTVKDAPDTQTVTFTIGTPGEYSYYCDTHAEAMKGVFTATP